MSTPADRVGHWLPWSNLLQFLGRPEDQTAAVIAGAPRSRHLMWDDLWTRHRAAAVPPPFTPPGADEMVVRPLTDEEQNELELLIGDDLRALVAGAVGAGAALPEIGLELDGVPVEADWPDRKVAVLTENGKAPTGWDARPTNDWTRTGLVAALEVDR